MFIHLRGRREKSIDPQVIRAKNRRFFKGLKHCIVQIRTFRGLTPESPEIRTMDMNKKTEGNKSFLRTENYSTILYERILTAILKADNSEMRRISDFAEDIVYGGN